MHRDETDLLIARCCWLAVHQQPRREAVVMTRHALVYAAFVGADIPRLIEHTRNMLMSQGRLRLINDQVSILYEGDDWKTLNAFVEEATQTLKIELYASLIGHTPETVAALCEKRALSVLALGDELTDDPVLSGTARVYQAAFLHEMLLLINEPAETSAIQVADRIDHFFTQFAYTLARRQPTTMQKHPVASEVNWTKLARGLRHGELIGHYRFGRLHAHLLEISPKYWRIKTATAGGLPAGQRDLSAIAKVNNARHATSGGFALPAPHDGEPIGLLINDGNVLNPPTLKRSAFLADTEGLVDIWRVGPIGMRIHCKQATVVVRKVNTERIRPGEIVVYTGAYHSEIPTTPLQITLRGRRVVQVARDQALSVPENGLLLAIHPGPAGAGALDDIEPGHHLFYELPPMRGLGRIDTAIAGGPALLVDGHRDCDLEADDFNGQLPPSSIGPRLRFGQALRPRTAWGITDDYRLIAVTVDGWDPSHSVGIDLDNLARFMADLGCRQALNLAGGAQAQMVVDGEVVDRSSKQVFGEDASGLRQNLANAILVVEKS